MKVILKNYLSNNKMVDKLLVFDLTGKFACWKKFYSNSSSFTYEIPSRTALIGILASILELPRDSYYKTFSSDNCKISLSVKSSLKKKFYCMNYFKKPNQRDYTQVRLEILTPINIQEDLIKYRVYVSIKNETLFNELVSRVKNKNHGFGVYMGQRQFRGDIKFVSLISKENIENIEKSSEIHSISNINNLEKKEDLVNSEYVSETMPLDFKFCGSDNELNTNRLNREIEKTGQIIFTTNANESLKTNSSFKEAFEISYKDFNENIINEKICFY